MHPSSRGRGELCERSQGRQEGGGDGGWCPLQEPGHSSCLYRDRLLGRLPGARGGGTLKVLGRNSYAAHSVTHAIFCVCVSQGEYRGHSAAQASRPGEGLGVPTSLRPPAPCVCAGVHLGNSPVKTGGSLWTHTRFFPSPSGSRWCVLGGKSPHPPWSRVTPNPSLVTPPGTEITGWESLPRRPPRAPRFFINTPSWERRSPASPSLSASLLA